MPLLALIRPCGVFSSTHQIALAQNYVKIRKQAIANQKLRSLTQSGLLDSLLITIGTLSYGLSVCSTS